MFCKRRGRMDMEDARGLRPRIAADQLRRGSRIEHLFECTPHSGEMLLKFRNKYGERTRPLLFEHRARPTRGVVQFVRQIFEGSSRDAAHSRRLLEAHKSK